MSNAALVPPAGFDELPVDEQIDYVNFLWDRIGSKTASASVPEWHKKLLDERHAAYAANPDTSVPWEEFYEELCEEFGNRR